MLYFFDRNESVIELIYEPKIYIPSTLNIDLILWPTQLIVYALVTQPMYVATETESNGAKA